MTRNTRFYDLIRSFAERLPHFPDGRIDYTHADIAPVVTIFVSYQGKVLLLKRSNQVLTYKGKWNTVAGYLDELKPLQEKVFEELSEELGIIKRDIKTIHMGTSYSFTDTNIERTWIVHPVSVELTHKIKIYLDLEHTEYRWIHPSEIKHYDTVPNLPLSLQQSRIR